MFYTVYKTTNKINGKIYIGYHETSNLNDGYLGSGTAIKRAISKYGEENFEKEILFIYETFEEMEDKEKELITPEMIKSNECYNMIPGGTGNWANCWEVPEIRERMLAGCRKGGIAQIKHLQSHNKANGYNYGPAISKGKTGAIFVYNDELEICKCVQPEDFQTYIDNGWHKGKKFINPGTDGFIWIKKGSEHTLIDPELFETYEKDGWVKGRIFGNSNAPEHQAKRAETRKRNSWKKYCDKVGIEMDRPEEGSIITLVRDDETRNIEFGMTTLNVQYKKGWIYNGKNY